MALKRLPKKYNKAEAVVRDYLSDDDSEDTAALIRRLRPAKVRGYLTKSELEAVCHWKSPRALRLIQSNSAATIRGATSRALATRSERRRLEELTALQGVSVPMASAILMLLDPERYGVIDIRVWQLLYALGTVSGNADGKGFTFNHWYRFLMIIRHIARKLRTTARRVEVALFLAHRDYQKDVLYD